MAMKRRGFLAALYGIGAALAVSGRKMLKEKLPERWIVALRGKRYPGPTRDFDKKAASKPGKWAG